MSAARSSTGRAWMALLLAAALAVGGWAVFVGPGTASAQESPPAPTVAPREDTSNGETVAPATDQDAEEQVVIAPAPDGSAQEQEQAAEETPEDASDAEIVVAPASDDAGEELIAPGPSRQSGDDGDSWWFYGLLAGAGLAAAAGAGTLAWRLRRDKA